MKYLGMFYKPEACFSASVRILYPLPFKCKSSRVNSGSKVDIQCPKSHVTVAKKGKFWFFFYLIHTISFKRPRYLTQTLKQI